MTNDKKAVDGEGYPESTSMQLVGSESALQIGLAISKESVPTNPLINTISLHLSNHASLSSNIEIIQIKTISGITNPLPVSLHLILSLLFSTTFHKGMKDRMERFSSLHFSIGCASQSSIPVGESKPRRAASERPPAPPKSRQGGPMKSSSLALRRRTPRPNVFAGLQKVLKGFKRLSQLFVLYRGHGDDDEVVEMVIGLPTDVKHVAHIGWDGFNNVGTTMKGWDLPVPSLSMKQFELAMAAQADGPLANGNPLSA